MVKRPMLELELVDKNGLKTNAIGLIDSGADTTMLNIQNDIQSQIDSSRVQQRETEDRRSDDLDADEAIQDDIEFAFMQMKAGTLEKLIDALNRLEQEAYGNCYECHGEIAEARLTALPFAVRCKECEEECERRRQERDTLLSCYSIIITYGIV